MSRLNFGRTAPSVGLRFCIGVIALGGLLVTGCGGSSSSSSSPSAPSAPAASPHGTMSATIDGVAWIAGGLTASISNNKGSLVVSGVDATSTISLGFAAASPTPEANPLAPGRVLDIPGTTSNARIELFTNGLLRDTYIAAPGSGGSGSITINTLTSTGASGTFSFVMKQQGGAATKTVTNGVFNVTF